MPVELAPELVGHDVLTVRQQRWSGLRNGVLLRAAADAGFEVLITADRSLPLQQNLRAIGIAVVVITKVRNRIGDLLALTPQIERALAIIRPGDALEITPTRRDSVWDGTKASAEVDVTPLLPQRA